MAAIDTGGGHSGRKVINQELALIPFIDLLLCCVMFLLVTAVWNELGGMGANLPGAAGDSPGPEDEPRLEVLVSESGFTLRSNIGTELQLPVVDGEYDWDGLRTQAHRYRMDAGRPYPVALQPDDGVSAGHIVGTMDVLRGEGFDNIGFPGG